MAAGVVLAGGRSQRMGSPKASLEWHGSTLLRHVTGVLRRAVDGPVIVVRAPGQPLPPLPADVEVRDDPLQGLGPLQGLAVGLRAAGDRAGVAFACATDLPFLHPAFVRRVLAGLASAEQAEVVLPRVRGFRQPLAAAYRTSLADVIDGLLAGGERRPGVLLERCTVMPLDATDLLADPVLAAVDPGLASVENVNTPEDYRRARGRPAPAVRVECAPSATDPRRGGRSTPVRAATLAAAAHAAGLPLAAHLVELNGDAVKPDPFLPLVAGDVVRLRAEPAQEAGDRAG